jgi:hypothetical protein
MHHFSLSDIGLNRTCQATRHESGYGIGAGSAEPIGPYIPDADLVADYIDRHQLVPCDSLGQADLVEGLGKLRLT